MVILPASLSPSEYDIANAFAVFVTPSVPPEKLLEIQGKWARRHKSIRYGEITSGLIEGTSYFGMGHVVPGQVPA